MLKSSLNLNGQPCPETEVALLIADKALDEVKKNISRQNRAYAVGLSVLVLGILVFLTAFPLPISLLMILSGIASLGYGYISKPQIEIRSISKVYWSGTLVPFSDRTSLLIDNSSIFPDKTITFNTLSDPELLERNLNDLVAKSQELEAQTIFSGERNLDGTIPHESSMIQTLQDVTRLTSADSIISRTVSLPVLEARLQFINKLINETQENRIDRVPKSTLGSINIGNAQNQVDGLRVFQGRKDEALDFLVEVLGKLSRNIKSIVDTYNRNTELMSRHLGLFNNLFDFGSHYILCPLCIVEDVKSKMSYDHIRDSWTCHLCTKEIPHKFSTIRVHKIKNDLLDDIWENLWIEKTDVKNSTINDISNQKRNMAHEEYKQKQEALREFDTLIKGLESKMRDLRSDIAAGLFFAVNLAGLMKRYELIEQERIEQYLNQASETERQVVSKYNSIRGEIKAFEDARLKKALGEQAVRSRIKASWNNYRAKEKTKGLRKIYEELHDENKVRSIDEVDMYGMPLASMDFFKNRSELKEELARIIEATR